MSKARKLIIAGNWKMHKTAPQGRELTQDIIQDLKAVSYTQLKLPTNKAV